MILEAEKPAVVDEFNPLLSAEARLDNAAERLGLVVTYVVETIELPRFDGGRCYCHRKLFAILCHWSTLSAPCGAHTVSIASLPLLEKM